MFNEKNNVIIVYKHVPQFYTEKCYSCFNNTIRNNI